MGNKSLHGFCFKLPGFCFNLKVDEEAGHLENSPLYYLAVAPLRGLSAYGESSKTTVAFSRLLFPVTLRPPMGPQLSKVVLLPLALPD